jgi:hypothetical protein
MRLRALASPNLIVVVVMALATLGSFGPHLLMLGYKVAGAQPPATLLFFCPLHQLGEQPTAARNANTLVIGAKQLTASGVQR